MLFLRNIGQDIIKLELNTKREKPENIHSGSKTAFCEHLVSPSILTMNNQKYKII